MAGLVCVGVDVGATSIKAGLVETDTGAIVDRREEKTPSPATPDAIVELVAEMVAKLCAQGPVGIAVPGRVRDGVLIEAVNLDLAWAGMHLRRRFSAGLDRPVEVVNDADAAGLAEARFGAAYHESGRTLVITLGSGIGTALVEAGRLIPRLELGQLSIDGVTAEHTASAAAMRRNRWSLREWTTRVNRFIAVAEEIISPDLIVIGGGITDRREAWWKLLQAHAPCEVARLRGSAGVIGAALCANDDIPVQSQGSAAWTCAQPTAG